MNQTHRHTHTLCNNRQFLRACIGNNQILCKVHSLQQSHEVSILVISILQTRKMKLKIYSSLSKVTHSKEESQDS